MDESVQKSFLLEWSQKSFRRLDIFSCRVTLLLSFFFVFVFSSSLYAEGSRDLYPSGAQGYRAYLLSSTTDANFNPFSNPGRM